MNDPNQPRSCQDLLVWQKGLALGKAVYELTRALPSEERFGLASQPRRAAVSVPRTWRRGKPTEEIGIRLALGAQRGDVLREVLRQGLKLTVLGAAIGLLGAVALTRVLAHLLFEIDSRDPVAFAGGAVLLVAVAQLACWPPERRATRVDPLVALRPE